MSCYMNLLIIYIPMLAYAGAILVPIAVPEVWRKLSELLHYFLVSTTSCCVFLWRLWRVEYDLIESLYVRRDQNHAGC